MTLLAYVCKFCNKYLTKTPDEPCKKCFRKGVRSLPDLEGEEEDGPAPVVDTMRFYQATEPPELQSRPKDPDAQLSVYSSALICDKPGYGTMFTIGPDDEIGQVMERAVEALSRLLATGTDAMWKKGRRARLVLTLIDLGPEEERKETKKDQAD